MSNLGEVCKVPKSSTKSTKRSKQSAAPTKKVKDNKKYYKLTYDKLPGVDKKSVDYECNLCPNKLGHLDSVARHYISAHPSRINYLRNKLSLRDFLIAKAKIYIDNILERKVLRNDKYGNRARKILIDLIFDPATINIIDQYNNGYYSKFKGTKIISNIEKDVYIKFFDFVENYIKKIRKCIDELELVNLSKLKDDEFIKNVNFEKYIDFNNYKTFRRGYYFLIDVPRIPANKENINSDNRNDIDNYLKKSDENFAICRCRFCNKCNSKNFSLLPRCIIHNSKEYLLGEQSGNNQNEPKSVNKDKIAGDKKDNSMEPLNRKDKKIDKQDSKEIKILVEKYDNSKDKNNLLEKKENHRACFRKKIRTSSNSKQIISGSIVCSHSQTKFNENNNSKVINKLDEPTRLSPSKSNKKPFLRVEELKENINDAEIDDAKKDLQNLKINDEPNRSSKVNTQNHNTIKMTIDGERKGTIVNETKKMRGNDEQMNIVKNVEIQKLEYNNGDVILSNIDKAVDNFNIIPNSNPNESANTMEIEKPVINQDSWDNFDNFYEQMQFTLNGLH